MSLTARHTHMQGVVTPTTDTYLHTLTHTYKYEHTHMHTLQVMSSSGRVELRRTLKEAGSPVSLCHHGG